LLQSTTTAEESHFSATQADVFICRLLSGFKFLIDYSVSRTVLDSRRKPVRTL